MKKVIPPIRIKMKIGTVEIEMECEEEQLQPAIEGILETIAQRMKASTCYQIDDRDTAPTRTKTCKGEIQRLWEEAWFSSPKYVNEVHAELVKRGFHYHPSAVSHALSDLVREAILTREGIPRRYRYMQRAVHS